MAVYNYISDTGTIVPDTTQIQQDVVQEYRDLFGADLVVTPNTPQGMLITAEQLNRIAVAENNAKLANQINPNLAGGVYLDAIMALTNPFSRKPATQSIVFARVAGTPGTVIPAGSIASETGTGDNNQFATVIDVTLPAEGYIDFVQFNSIVFGPIPCAVGMLTNIVTPVLGWDTVGTNDAAILGVATQSDIQARRYRLDTLATQGASVAEAITAEIIRTTDAKSVSFLENPLSVPDTVDGVSMVAHSIYVCVDGTEIGSQTFAVAAVTGIPGTVIPTGSQVSSNGNIFSNLAPLTIPAGGTLDPAFFVAEQYGPVPCPIGTLTTIVTPVAGWTSVNNTIAPATLGTESPIAQALVAKKSAGAAYNNGPGQKISALVTVPYSGQNMTVLFDIPNQVPINVFVAIKILTATQNATQLVQDAITTYATGGINGIAGLTVGQNVSSFELAGAITALHPGIYVQSLLIAKSPTSPTSPDEIDIKSFEVATIAAGDIIVNVVE